MFLALIIVIFVLIGVYTQRNVQKRLQFWQNKGVPHMKPWWILGNMAPTVFRRKAFVDLIDEYYQHYYHGRFFGFYQFLSPVLVVKDVDLIKQICIKDFEHFPDHTDFLPKESDPFWKNGLFGRDGKDWHDMRLILSPAFTSGKLKGMFHLMIECAREFISYVEQAKGNVIPLEMRDTITKLTNDVIASTAFGFKCNSFRQQDNEFYVMGKEAFDFSGIKGFKFFGYSISPSLMKILKVTMFGERATNFFRRIVKETMEYRSKTGFDRPDIIHLLRQAQKGTLKDDNETTRDNSSNFENEPGKTIITDEDITAQVAVFFFGGYDTTAALICNTLYGLALNSDVQIRLIEEVDDILTTSGDNITYEALMRMKYLEMVISETLRLWSPSILLHRKCAKPYIIEPKLPGEKPLRIEAGAEIVIPIYSTQRNPQYFSNPTKFNPERFSDDNKNNLHPCTCLSFGIGPRMCIGNRFGLLSAKIGIFYLLSRFKIVPIEKTSIPFVADRSTIVLHHEHGCWLGLERRTINVK